MMPGLVNCYFLFDFSLGFLENEYYEFGYFIGYWLGVGIMVYLVSWFLIGLKKNMLTKSTLTIAPIPKSFKQDSIDLLHTTQSELGFGSCRRGKNQPNYR